MVITQPLVAEFTLIGKLEDLVINSKGRVKYLYLSSSEQNYSIKVAKEPKNILSQHLKRGCRLKISGMRKCSPQKPEFEYKAYVIELLAEPIRSQSVISLAKPKPQVLICQSSNCYKQGSKTVYEKLRTELENRGIANQVDIKITGCLKHCKQSPNLIMPARIHYGNVRPQQVSALIAKHLS